MTDYERIKAEYDLSLLKKQKLLDLVWPVGSVYISIDNTNPSVRFGGVWEQIKDRFILASGDAHKVCEAGGEEMVQLTVENLPRHAHGNPGVPWEVWSDDAINMHFATDNYGEPVSFLASYVGKDQPHNNMPPYLAVCMWIRIS